MDDARQQELIVEYLMVSRSLERLMALVKCHERYFLLADCDAYRQATIQAATALSWARLPDEYAGVG